MLTVSRDALLRAVRRRAAPTGAAPVTVIGIDDFAWKRGQRYGTLTCGLEQRRIVDFLPDREPFPFRLFVASGNETKFAQ